MTTPRRAARRRGHGPGNHGRQAAPIVPALAMRKRRRSQSGMGAAGRRGGARGEGDAAGQLQQPAEHRQTGPDREQPAHERERRRRQRIAQPGERGREPEDHEDRRPIAEPPPGQDAGTAATTTAASRITTWRASLSLVPKRATTRSFAPAGWRAMTRSPTATTRDGASATRPANSSPAATAATPAAAPASAAAQAGIRPGLVAEAGDRSWQGSVAGFMTGACRRPGRPEGSRRRRRSIVRPLTSRLPLESAQGRSPWVAPAHGGRPWSTAGSGRPATG